jgi:O-antigen/teichoic acid export membrane protein
MNLGATVLTYWLFAYRNCLFSAHQRNDISSKVALLTDTIKYVLQIVVLILFKNYYLFLIVMLVTQVIHNVLVALYSKRFFPEYEPKGRLSKEKISSINHRIKDLFTSKMGTVVVGSADTIIISSFLGLTSLTIYQNYYYPVSAVMGIVKIIYQACTAGIGNSLIVETKEKNYRDLRKFTFIILWIAGVCFSCFLAMYQPFMEIWVGKKLMVEYSVVICFSVYFFIMQINSLLNLYKDAAGIWHADRFRPLVTALSNLIMNLLMVRRWGLYGIILSTVISALIVGMPWLLHNLFTVLFERQYLQPYLFFLLTRVVIVLAVSSGVSYLASFVVGNLWMEFIARLIICTVITNIVFYLSFRNSSDYIESIALVKRLAKSRQKK